MRVEYLPNESFGGKCSIYKENTNMHFILYIPSRALLQFITTDISVTKKQLRQILHISPSDGQIISVSSKKYQYAKEILK